MLTKFRVCKVRTDKSGWVVNNGLYYTTVSKKQIKNKSEACRHESGYSDERTYASTTTCRFFLRGFFLIKPSCWAKRAPLAHGSQGVPKDIATLSLSVSLLRNASFTADNRFFNIVLLRGCWATDRKCGRAACGDDKLRSLLCNTIWSSSLSKFSMICWCNMSPFFRGEGVDNRSRKADMDGETEKALKLP